MNTISSHISFIKDAIIKNIQRKNFAVKMQHCTGATLQIQRFIFID